VDLENFSTQVEKYLQVPVDLENFFVRTYQRAGGEREQWLRGDPKTK
jgi:hypothetical protein